jgi:hypothetical protein
MSNMYIPETDTSQLRLTWRESLSMTKRFMLSYYQALRDDRTFQTVKTYCMFVGHARSGGSILGALLDAHPQIVIGDEVDVLKHLPLGFSRDQIFHMILARSQRQARKGRTKGGRDGRMYSYFVPGQWQGQFSQLRVIGDSKAGISTQRIAHDPTLLDRLTKVMERLDFKVVHIVRNPFDTVSTMNIRAGRPIANGIERYFTNCSTILALRNRLPAGSMLSVQHEYFIDNPATCLTDLCRFLGVAPTPGYLDACTGILYQSPAKSRHKVTWSPELIDIVRRQIDRYDFLQGYSYDA